MPRYGDFDKLEKELNERLRDLREEYGGYDAYTDGFDEAVTRIENAPTADVVEVVRCKDCKWNSKTFKDVMYSHCLHPRSMTMIENQDEHFCGYGERRTDEA